jgi:hypothetical protein
VCNIYSRIFLSTFVLLLSINTVQALPFSSFDPRSMAMGGTGVAVGDPSTAPFFNPAMLTASDSSKKFSFEFPIIGVRLIDPANMHNNLQTLSNNINALSSSLATVNAAAATSANAATIQQLPSSMTALATQIDKVNSSLASLNNQPIQGELGVATVIGIPGKELGFAVYVDAWGAMGGTLEYNDGPTLTSLATSVKSAAATLSSSATACAAVQAGGTGATTANVQTCLGAANGLVSVQGAVSFSTSTGITSKVHIRGVAIDEAGLSISRGFVTNDHAWSFGITPKLMQLRLFDALLAASNGTSTSGLIANDYLASYSTLNFDVGVAETNLNGWRTGLVIKNVIPHTFDFKQATTTGGTPVADGSTLKMNPQLRTGVSYENKWSTVAVDLDLTRNNPAGLENQSQYAGIGGEVSTADWVQIRAGYRYDMINPSQKEFSLGFGLSPRFPFFKSHMDFAVTASPDIFSTGWNNAVQAGASMKLGLNF